MRWRGCADVRYRGTMSYVAFLHQSRLAIRSILVSEARACGGCCGRSKGGHVHLTPLTAQRHAVVSRIAGSLYLSKPRFMQHMVVLA